MQPITTQSAASEVLASVAESVPVAWTQIPRTELDALIALYEATDGENWINNDGWLDPEVGPSGWHRVSVWNGHVDQIQLWSNALTGQIPSGLSALVRLRALSLADNTFTGEIPASLGGLGLLSSLHLGDNGLTGSIPSELGGLGNLRTLSLGRNDLTGEIPASLGDLANLELLLLHENALTGQVPDRLGELVNLRSLWLGGNRLSGEIPASLGGLASLEQLLLWQNDLTGPIPSELGGLGNLRSLGIGNNSLTGAIPASIGDLESLEKLELYSNDLTGDVPPELGNLARLEVLRLEITGLSGPVPETFTQLSALRTLYFFATDLCEPREQSFQEWLASIPNVSSTGVLCAEDGVIPEPPAGPNLRPCRAFTFRFLNGAECALLAYLRSPTYFGIEEVDATDQELLEYIGNHRRRVELLLAQVAYGWAFAAYLDDPTVRALPEERQFFQRLDRAEDVESWLEALSVLVTFSGDPVAGGLMGQSAHVFGTILLGIKAYRTGLIAITDPSVPGMIQFYLDARKDGLNQARAWSETYETFGDVATGLISARNGIQEEQVATWLENAYLAYRLVKYEDSAAIRLSQGLGIAKAAQD
jgi:hypothetical protein